MAGPKYQQTPDTNQITLTTGHANEYAGTNATAGKTGAATPNGSQHTRFRASSRGTSIANMLRVFKKKGATKTFLFEVVIPARSVVLGGQAAWATVIATGDLLADTDESLAYSIDQTDTGIDITEEVWRFV